MEPIDLALALRRVRCNSRRCTCASGVGAERRNAVIPPQQSTATANTQRKTTIHVDALTIPGSAFTLDPDEQLFGLMSQVCVKRNRILRFDYPGCSGVVGRGFVGGRPASAGPLAGPRQAGLGRARHASGDTPHTLAHPNVKKFVNHRLRNVDIQLYAM